MALALAVVLVLGACRFAQETEVAPPSAPGTAEPSAAAPAAADAPENPTAAPLDRPVEVPDAVPDDLKAVWEVWSLLNTEHVDRDEIDPEEFTEAAIRGMLEALDDPHTNYVPPEAFDIENEDLLGRFEGIGANVSMTAEGRLVVVAPISGSPAENAGIRPGDVILEVDGESIEGLSLLEAVNKIRGPRGSRVELLVRHVGSQEAELIEVERGVIPLQSVLLRSEPGDEIAHIRLTNFYTDTADKLSSTIDEAVSGGAKGIILDVRDNPGGLLSSVVDVSSLFLEDGLILYEVDGSGRRTDWQVRRNGGVAEDIPMVMLANEFSASASEILVGALQDHQRATIIGETTFGKGSVNVLRELGNGGGLFITFARWYTPTGRLIQGNGLEPDVMVTDRDARTEDTLQLEKAFELLESQVRAKASGSIGS